jgi:hypothetical protein
MALTPVRPAPLIAAMFMLCAVVVGCGDTLQGREYAEREVARFRALMKAREFEQIYDTSAPEFQAGTPRHKGVALFAAVDRKLGALRSTQQLDWELKTWKGMTSVVLTYYSKYQKGEATETFTVLVDDGKPRLAGYFINSIDMLIR